MEDNKRFSYEMFKNEQFFHCVTCAKMFYPSQVTKILIGKSNCLMLVCEDCLGKLLSSEYQNVVALCKNKLGE